MKQQDGKSEGNFLTGVVMGSIIGAGAVYLTMTKEGRKLARTILSAAETWGERGEDYLQDLTGEQMEATKEGTTKTKMKSLINRLKK